MAAKGDCEKWTPIEPGFETVTKQRAEHAQQELDSIRAEPFLGTKHMNRKKRLC